MRVKAYAKINLSLDILSKLENGYHDLYMLMQSVSLFDEVDVELNDLGKITISCDVADIPTDERNIAYKSAERFFEFTGKENPGVSIDIKKSIPHAAGLAGGSTDGAAVIYALNRLCGAGLSDRQIMEICAEVGSDVPFCAVGGTMIAQGTGTILTYMPNLDLPYIVIVKPPCSVSTGEAYREFDTADHVVHTDRQGIFKAAASSDINGICLKVANVFEQFIFVPQRADIKSTMRRCGAQCACMSGSGPSIFGIFESKEEAEKCAAELRTKFKDVFLTSSMPCGVEICD